jgi:acid stress chaperone HdeB
VISLIAIFTSLPSICFFGALLSVYPTYQALPAISVPQYVFMEFIMINKFTLSTVGIFATAILATASVSAVSKEVTPNNMNCEEFIDLNPQTMAPVAFWMLNKDVDFKGGDYVDFNETETTAVPLTLEICKKHPQSALNDIKDTVKSELKK